MRTIDTDQIYSAIADDMATVDQISGNVDHDLALPNLDCVDAILWSDTPVHVAG